MGIMQFVSLTGWLLPSVRLRFAPSDLIDFIGTFADEVRLRFNSSCEHGDVCQVPHGRQKLLPRVQYDFHRWIGNDATAMRAGIPMYSCTEFLAKMAKP